MFPVNPQVFGHVGCFQSKNGALECDSGDLISNNRIMAAKKSTFWWCFFGWGGSMTKKNTRRS